MTYWMKGETDLFMEVAARVERKSIYLPLESWKGRKVEDIEFLNKLWEVNEVPKCAMCFCKKETTPKTVYCEKHRREIRKMLKKIRTVG